MSIARDYEIAFATLKNSNGYFSLRAAVPRDIFSAIGDPDRIRVIGSPFEGYVFEPTEEREPGTYAINYELSGRNINLTMAYKPTRLSKVERRLIKCAATVRRKAVHVAGMPEPWIKGETPWVDGAPANVEKPKPPADAKPVNGEHHRLSANPTSGLLAAPPAPVPAATTPLVKPDFKIGPDVSTDQLKARLGTTLRMASAMKAELEKRTGLRLRIGRDLLVYLDLGE